jgi:hypothetical protein
MEKNAHKRGYREGWNQAIDELKRVVKELGSYTNDTPPDVSDLFDEFKLEEPSR